uniref:Ig-like domain-containing protein n=1 Tax=Scleropages formosus TaxID=113540 RepID=A0A8C9VYH9_SCLFO
QTDRCIFFFFVLFSVGVDADKVEQEPLIYFLEGDKALLTCNHDITNFNSMYWYVQHVNKEPEYIIHGFNEADSKGRFSVDVDRKGRSTNLSISDTQTEDSAVYYCAVEPTVIHCLTVTEKHCILTITERSTVVYYIKWLIYHFLLIDVVTHVSFWGRHCSTNILHSSCNSDT